MCPGKRWLCKLQTFTVEDWKFQVCQVKPHQEPFSRVFLVERLKTQCWQWAEKHVRRRFYSVISLPPMEGIGGFWAMLQETRQQSVSCMSAASLPWQVALEKHFGTKADRRFWWWTPLPMTLLRSRPVPICLCPHHFTSPTYQVKGERGIQAFMGAQPAWLLVAHTC